MQNHTEAHLTGEETANESDKRPSAPLAGQSANELVEGRDAFLHPETVDELESTLAVLMTRAASTERARVAEALARNAGLLIHIDMDEDGVGNHDYLDPVAFLTQNGAVVLPMNRVDDPTVATLDLSACTVRAELIAEVLDAARPHLGVVQDFHFTDTNGESVEVETPDGELSDEAMEIQDTADYCYAKDPTWGGRK